MAISGSVWKLLLIGLVFHLVYIGTVFDCYFTSPVVHGMFRHSLPSGEAKRLVLIVGTPCRSRALTLPHLRGPGDGLRADLLFAKNGFHMVPEAPEVVAPHLRSIVQERGAFGISHTRVPTESRPGHVALIGTHLIFAHWVPYRPSLQGECTRTYPQLLRYVAMALFDFLL